MPPAKKRKTSRASTRATTRASEQLDQAPTPPAPATSESPEPAGQEQDEVAEQGETEQQKDSDISVSETMPAPDNAADKAKDRMARFRALQARAKTSSDQNLKEATKESQRLTADPSALTAVHRRRDIAAHKLLKAETEEAGEDFERKRAWDWTAEESERWDKRLKKKSTARDNSVFQDYRAESNKVYKRKIRDMAPDLDRYEKDKLAAVEKAAAAGGLDIVETEEGELIAVDKDGSFYSTADSTSFAESKPDKAAVDRLVNDMRKAEETRLRKRRERIAQNGDDGDVTYINEKNKMFNQKLSRFYNKYTAEVRDSFERGTMI